MRILLSNDDGYNSEGIISLAKKLKEKHEVIIVAPDSNRSAYSHSLSVRKKFKVEKTYNDGILTYIIYGTPCDCVKFYFLEIYKDFPVDLVVAGINKGHNLGTDILYSGTLSIAIEAAVFKCKSIAFSCTNHNQVDFSGIVDVCDDIIDRFFDKISPSFVLNVNIPSEIKHKEYKITPLGKQIYSDNYQKVSENEYFLTGQVLVHPENPHDCDVVLRKEGYVTITPIIYDKTSLYHLNKLKETFNQIDGDKV